MSEKKKCILHIGSFKTGTTSLQMTLAQNRDLLKKYGFIYPDIGFNHTFLVVCCGENHKAWPTEFKKRMDTKASAARFRREMLAYLAKTAEAAGSDTVIFSSEYLVTLHPDRVAALKALLDRHFDGIVVVCYIRHPRSHTVSLAQQSIKAGFADLDAIQERKSIFRPSRLDDTYIKSFGPEALRVREFNRETLVNGDIIDDFCSTVGMPAELVTSLKRAHGNESLSMEAALIASAVAKDLPRAKGRKWNPARSRAFEASLRQISGQKFTLAPEVLDLVESDIEDEANYVRERFGLAMKPPATSAIDPGDLWKTATLRDIGLIINTLGQQVERLQQENAISRIRLLLLQKKADEAARLLQQTFKNKRNSPKYYVLLSRIEQARGNRTGARQALAAGRKQFPRIKRLRARSGQSADG